MRPKQSVPFVGPTEEMALDNHDFRRVVYTGPELQLVLMFLRRGEDIGVETHARVEQSITVVSGNGTVTLGNKRYRVVRGDTIVIPPGTRHNLRASTAMNLLTTYSPPNHPDGTVHATKANARSDKKDAAFSARVNG